MKPSAFHVISNINSTWMRVTYNSKFYRMRGSHFMMTVFVTQFFILAPSLLCQFLALIPNLTDNMPLYLTFSILHWLTLFLSMYALHRCSATEPGIIPCFQNIPRVPVDFKEKVKVKENMSVEVRYKTYEEMANDYDELGFSPLEKYFSVNKFAYKARDPEAPIGQVRLSYCFTCKLQRPPRAYHC